MQNNQQLTSLVLSAIACQCRQDIEDYDERLDRALSLMQILRCPLYLADADLAEEISKCANDWFSNFFNAELLANAKP